MGAKAEGAGKPGQLARILREISGPNRIPAKACQCPTIALVVPPNLVQSTRFKGMQTCRCPTAGFFVVENQMHHAKPSEHKKTGRPVISRKDAKRAKQTGNLFGLRSF
jgi:hypothetical protein